MANLVLFSCSSSVDYIEDSWCLGFGVGKKGRLEVKIREQMGETDTPSLFLKKVKNEIGT